MRERKRMHEWRIQWETRQTTETKLGLGLRQRSKPAMSVARQRLARSKETQLKLEKVPTIKPKNTSPHADLDHLFQHIH